MTTLELKNQMLQLKSKLINSKGSLNTNEVINLFTEIKSIHVELVKRKEFY